MIKVKKILEKKDYEQDRKIMELFGYEILKVKERKNTVKVFAQVNEEDPSYYSHYDLYKRVSKWSILPLWPLLTFAGISFALVTALLIIYLCNRENQNMFTYLMAIGIPAAAFLLSAVIYSSVKFKADTHNIQPAEEYDEIKKELDEINEKRSKQEDER